MVRQIQNKYRTIFCEYELPKSAPFTGVNTLFTGVNTSCPSAPFAGVNTVFTEYCTMAGRAANEVQVPVPVFNWFVPLKKSPSCCFWRLKLNQPK